mmetsp:Transcript_13958/g.25252  ORF Transcript_13958/g.25252 Transcript_13958/m.25252 type:complete len:386 (-) Transcript_13958:531-1688(-)
MSYNEDSSASGHDEPWIQWFCSLKGHEMFCEVERSYIEDGFNLYGLRACVSNFSDCLDLILDRIGPDDSDDSHLAQSACTLYGLIHARYIITAHGLDAMYNKYAGKEFGTCPLVQCAGQPVLPVGLKDEMGTDSVKIFCPKCQCVYHPVPIRSRGHHGSGSGGSSGIVDGASFGTTFAHLFLMTFNNLMPDPLAIESAYVPRVFGFRVHQTARQKVGVGGIPSAAAFPSSSQIQEANKNAKSSQSSGRTGTGANDTMPANTANTSTDLGQADEAVADKTSMTSATTSQDGVASLPQHEVAIETSGKAKGSPASASASKKSGTMQKEANSIGAEAMESISGDSKNSGSKRRTISGGINSKNGGDSAENGSVSKKAKRQKRQNKAIS